MFAQLANSFWFPPPVSTFAWHVDALFYFILWISTFFFVLVVGMLMYFVWAFRRRDMSAPKNVPTHNTLLEVSWTVIPSLLCVLIFFFGFVGFMQMRTAPDDAMEIRVVGKQWFWNFKYTPFDPGDRYEESFTVIPTAVDEKYRLDPRVTADQSKITALGLHVPVNTPVKLKLSSDDVLHSFYIPAFRCKMDVVPGRYTDLWFVATEPGIYPVYCTEYCGKDHSVMIAWVQVHPTGGEFRKYIKEAMAAIKKKNPRDYGEYLYTSRGCANCHSVDGSAKVGPSFKGSWGKPRNIIGQGSVVMDENYVKESIHDPAAKVVQGFEPKMPPFRDLDTADIDAIVAFLKSLK